LGRYLDEQAFRFNEREHNDGERFRKVGASVAGKRLTHAELIGKDVPKSNGLRAMSMLKLNGIIAHPELRKSLSLE
jgi:hypothetical protein